jgi:MoaA/NifB/PqqE/SkfB family radical SAM enzyme
MGKRFKSPLSAHYEITEDCDNDCRHCYNPFRHERHHIPQEVRDGILKEIIDNEIFHIVITGGEPLMDKKGLFYVAEKLTKENVKISLNSNLNLMDEETAKTLVGLGVDSVLTSVLHHNPEIHDGITNNPGSLESCLNGIRTARESGMRVSANMVVDKERLKDVYETGKSLIPYGITGFCGTRVASHGKTETLNPEEALFMLDELLRFQEEYSIHVASLNPIPRCLSSDSKYDSFMVRGCSAGLIGADITQLGDMKACQHQEQTHGNILEEGLKVVWERVPILKEEVPEFCGECGECSGGCREIAGEGEVDPLAIGDFGESEEKIREKVDPSTNLRFYREIVHRNEENGTGTLFRAPSNYVNLKEDQYKLSLVLAKTVFSINGLVEEGFSPEIKRLINLLHNREIIKEA